MGGEHAGHTPVTLVRSLDDEQRRSGWGAFSISPGYFPRKARTYMGWDPRSERDACGIGFVADAEGRASRVMVETAIGALCNVRHRGAVASDAKTGDGAGLLIPISGRFFA